MKSKIRSVRISKGLTVEEVAKMANIKTQTYYKYESGARFPRREVMIRLASVLHESVEDLFFAQKLD